MKKLTMLTRRIFAALVLVAMFSPAVLASNLIGTYCVEINSLTRPFELATSEIGEGHYLLNGTYTDPASPNIGAVIGSASIADGSITMTLRASGINDSAMNVSTYQFDLSLNNLSGVFQSITQDSSGSVTHDIGMAALVDCASALSDPNDIDNDGDGFTRNMGDCDDDDSLINPDAYEICGDDIDQDCDVEDLICATENAYLRTQCNLYGASWIEQYLECEGITPDRCNMLGGQYVNCGSACRHMPVDTVCIAMCWDYCAFAPDNTDDDGDSYIGN